MRAPIDDVTPTSASGRPWKINISSSSGSSGGGRRRVVDVPLGGRCPACMSLYMVTYSPACFRILTIGLSYRLPNPNILRTPLTAVPYYMHDPLFMEHALLLQRETPRELLSPHVMRRHVVYCMFLWVTPATKSTKFGSRYLGKGSSERDEILQVARGG